MVSLLARGKFLPCRATATIFSQSDKKIQYFSYTILLSFDESGNQQKNRTDDHQVIADAFRVHIAEFMMPERHDLNTAQYACRQSRNNNRYVLLY